MKIYHWLYIVLILFIGIAQTVNKLMTDTGGVMSQYMPLLVATLLSGATYGLSKQQALLSRLLWLVSFWLLTFSAIGLLVLVFYLAWYLGIDAALQISLLLMAIALMVPGLLALYQYVYYAKAIWQKETKED